MAGVTFRVAFQGELGAYSEEAVLRHWDPDLAQPLPARTCADVVRAVEEGAAEYGLLPIENSLAGSVVATYDALAASRGVAVVGEMVLPIHHCLLALPGATLATLASVESHPVALAQCGHFLARHQSIEVRAAYDTAGAARDVARVGDVSRAAIAGRGAAERFGLQILAADIEDRPDNQTRFLALAREPAVLPPGVPAKTALLAFTANSPGSLHELLTPVARVGLNLAKLESRPTGEPWTYSFFLEFEHDSGDHRLARVLSEMQQCARSLRVLGHFERQQMLETGSSGERTRSATPGVGGLTVEPTNGLTGDTKAGLTDETRCAHADRAVPVAGL